MQDATTLTRERRKTRDLKQQKTTERKRKKKKSKRVNVLDPTLTSVMEKTVYISRGKILAEKSSFCD